MENKQLHRIKTIAEYHKVMGLPKPKHPLVSVINFESIKAPCKEGMGFIFDFYSISLKRDFKGKMKYGQQQSDFDEGILFCMSPGQVFGVEAKETETANHAGWLLLIHPDFLWNTPLAKTIKQYEYFSYSVHEGLFLSENEEGNLISIMQKMEQEYQANIDRYSRDVIIAQTELLLTYVERYYNRQFLTREKSNHQILDRLDEILTGYFNSDDLIHKGLPTVQSICEMLNVSVSYLSRVLKVLTGQSTQQHIHDKLIEKAKEKLTTSDLSVSEIAYELGFEHSQSFSKLFKTKTKVSPLEFRQSFN